MITRFSSKRDRWIVVLIWAGAVLATVGGFAQLGAQTPSMVSGAAFLFLLGGAGFMLWVLYATDYELGEQELLVRSGPVRYRVPFAEIESVTRSRDPRSSPATSLDRLHIRWGKRQLLISPDQRLEFLRELSLRCSHLSLHGEELTRAGAAQQVA